MLAYDGGQTWVDPSGWEQPVTSTRDGEEHPPPARWRNGERLPDPWPYTDDNPHVRRNFGRGENEWLPRTRRPGAAPS